MARSPFVAHNQQLGEFEREVVSDSMVAKVEIFKQDSLKGVWLMAEKRCVPQGEKGNTGNLYGFCPRCAWQCSPDIYM